MNNKFKLYGIAMIIVLAVVALWGGIAFAQSTISHMGYGWMMGGNGYGGMMGQYAQDGDDWEWMSSMHQWMTASGGMHTLAWDALSEKLGLTSDELYAEVNSGETIAQIAEEKGISRTDLVAALETAHKDSLAQAVTDGYLTQEQADSILNQMAGRYEWMLDNMGNGYGMMGGYGGRGSMMGGFNGQKYGSGQFTPGACHGNWYGSTDSQPKP